MDDEPLARERVRMLLETDADIEIVGECADGASAIASMEKLRPALVFLDVEMPEVDGFGVLHALESSPIVIFTTAHAHYALSAFEAEAFDYLLKPFSQERFFEVLARAKTQVERNVEYEKRQQAEPVMGKGRISDLLIVKTGGRLVFLKSSQVKWIEAQKDYVRLHLAKEVHLVRETMDGIQKKLDSRKFLRIHRSTIVNIHEIREIEPLLGGDHIVTLHDGTQLTLSRRYRASLDGLLGS